jgi:hypothetical protein
MGAIVFKVGALGLGLRRRDFLYVSRMSPGKDVNNKAARRICSGARLC